MTKITTIDRATCKLLADEINTALQAVAEKFGVAITPGGGVIGSTDFVCKVRVKLTDTGALETAERETWDRNCMVFGLRPEDFGTEIIMGRDRYRVTGLALNRSTRPIKILRLSDNSPRICGTEIVPLIKLATDAKAAT